MGSVPIILLLLKNMSPLNATDNEGYTPLHHAIAEGHGMFLINCAATLTNPVGDTAVALLKEGADFTIKNADDELPLDLAPDKEVRTLTTLLSCRTNLPGPEIYRTRSRT
mgnify:CR=1 FL=1